MNKIILLFSLIIGISVQAQTDTLLLNLTTEAEVSAPRMNLSLKEIPFSTNIVGQEILSVMPRGISIDEPLKLVPGVKIDNQANGNRIHLSIRGQGILTERGIRGIKILLDEIPVNDPTGFAPDLFDINFSNVDRIEILRGPAASLYGGSASAGIINIKSKLPMGNPLYAEASAIYGSNSFFKGSGAFGGHMNNVSYRVAFSRGLGDGYRDHTHFNLNNVYGLLTYTPASNIKLTPIFSYVKAFHDNPEGINLQQLAANPKQSNPDAIPFNEYLETERVINGLTGLMLFDQHEIQFNGYFKRTLFTEANNHTYNHRTIATPGASLQYSYLMGNEKDFIKNKISLGADLQWQTIDEHRHENYYTFEKDSVWSNEQIKQSGTGLFLIDKIDLGTNLGFMLSLRYDKIHNELLDLKKDPADLSGDADFSRATGRIGFTYSPVYNYTVYGNWGQGFLPPATEELAQNPDQVGGFNTHLTFATSNEFDLGLRGNPIREVYFDLSGFYMKTDNDFDRYRLSGVRNQETFYRNAASSDRIGLELYTRIIPAPDFKFETAYTYSHFKYTNGDSLRIVMDDPTIQKYILDGNYLPNSPMHQLYIDLQYEILNGLYIGAGSETYTKSYIDGANIESEAAEAYTLFSARVMYDFSYFGTGAQLSISMKNITDKKYVAFTEPDPGGNSYQPGSGREVFAGIKIKL